MTTVDIEYRDTYAIVKLNRPKAHAINHRLVNELRDVIDKLKDSEDMEGAILTATGSIFCAGLDEGKMDDFWEDFGRLLRDLVAFPKPLICAVNGHAPAGGCVLAMCCDYRFMADGNARIGLNEVPVGIVIPRPIVELARYTVGDTRAADMMFHGALLFPKEAGAFGLVHAVVPERELLAHAEEKLQSWLALPKEPWRQAKTDVRDPLLHAMDLEFSMAFGPTIRHWWSVESRSTIAKTIEKLKEKSKT